MSGAFVVWPGRFMVLSKGEVQVHCLDEAAERQFYDGLAIVEQRSSEQRRPEQLAYHLKQTFRCEVQAIFPCATFEALAFYMEHYEGPGQDKVRMMAAVILSGQQFRTDQDGGSRDRMPTPPPLPIAPAPAGSIPLTQEVAS